MSTIMFNKITPKQLLLFTLLIFVIALYFVVSPQSPNSNRHPPIKSALESNAQRQNLSQGVHGLLHNVTRQREPMIMSLDYGEQFSNALVCLGDLQCWANTVGIDKVVEPFIQTGSASTFRFLPNSSALKLSDLIDIDAWNERSFKCSLSTLASLETFLKHAIKEIVFVQLQFGALVHSCNPMETIMKTGWYSYLQNKGFRIIDTVCVDFGKRPEHCMSAKSFRDEIFNKEPLDHRNVSLLFDYWTGVRETKGNDDVRVCLKDSHCNDMRRAVRFEVLPPSTKNAHRSNSIHLPSVVLASPFIPSQRVTDIVNRFKSDFLSGAQYVAVMVRSEKLVMSSAISSAQARRRCMATILSDWKSVLANETNLKTLFFTDALAHGSTTLYGRGKVISTSFSKELEKQLVLEHHLRLSEVNQYLEKTAGIKNSVLIASVQRDIIAQAKCVIVVGAGVFQKMTVHMYAYYHKKDELCYSFRGKMCNESLFIHPRHIQS